MLFPGVLQSMTALIENLLVDFQSQPSNISLRTILKFRSNGGVPEIIKFLGNDSIDSVFFQLLERLCEDIYFCLEFGKERGHILLTTKYNQVDTETLETVESIIALTRMACSSSKFCLDHGHSLHMLQFPIKEAWPLERNAVVYIQDVISPMHGVGHHTVGYVLWPAATILSRWMLIRPELFMNNYVLEVGAGLGSNVRIDCGTSDTPHSLFF